MCMHIIGLIMILQHQQYATIRPVNVQNDIVAT